MGGYGLGAGKVNKASAQKGKIKMPEKALTCSGEIPEETGFKKVSVELERNTCEMQHKHIFKRGRLESFETS